MRGAIRTNGPSAIRKPAIRLALVAAALLLGAAVVPAPAEAGWAWGWGHAEYEVKITNVTPGQWFSPLVVYSHGKDHMLFELGMPASDEVAAIAEAGATDPLRMFLESMGAAFDIAIAGGLTPPGHTTTLTVRTRRHADRISLAAMMVPSNDAMVALRGADLPFIGSRTYYAVGYDAGSETNDESCETVPGPPFVCTGEALSPGDDGEGYVHVHAGISGIGDVDPAAHDWKNPVAEITITRVR